MGKKSVGVLLGMLILTFVIVLIVFFGYAINHIQLADLTQKQFEWTVIILLGLIWWKD